MVIAQCDSIGIMIPILSPFLIHLNFIYICVLLCEISTLMVQLKSNNFTVLQSLATFCSAAKNKYGSKPAIVTLAL